MLENGREILKIQCQSKRSSTKKEIINAYERTLISKELFYQIYGYSTALLSINRWWIINGKTRSFNQCVYLAFQQIHEGDVNDVDQSFIVAESP